MDDVEAGYYRTVEDFFAALRGAPHQLSPKDIQLLRGWWREGVPLHAVTSGIAETLARRRERGDQDPVVSLSYCRHAVKARARELGEMAAGADAWPAEPDSSAVGEAVAELARGLEIAATGLPSTHTAVAAAIRTVAASIRGAAELPPATAEQHLFALETALLEACWRALPAEETTRLDGSAHQTAAASGATGEALARTQRAMRDRALREHLALPRLELR
jgi:hypothetical protein